MSNKVYIEGAEDVLKTLADVPENANKIIKKALRSAGNVMAKTIRKNIPAQYADAKKRVKTKIINTDRGMSAKVGIFGKRSTDEVDVWFKSYWANYGTLKHRDSSHSFDYPIKNIKRRNNEGQSPQNFFDTAAEAGQQQMITAFEDSLEKQNNDLIKK